MPGYYDNYKVMAWFVNNYYGVITPAQSIKNQGRYYTNHFAITVSTCTVVLIGSFQVMKNENYRRLLLSLLSSTLFSILFPFPFLF